MFRTMSSRERTLVLISAGVVLVLLAWSWLLVPMLELQRHAAEMVPEREQVLERRRALIARKTSITAEMEATEARIQKLSERLLTAAAPALAAPEPQNSRSAQRIWPPRPPRRSGASESCRPSRTVISW